MNKSLTFDNRMSGNVQLSFNGEVVDENHNSLGQGVMLRIINKMNGDTEYAFPGVNRLGFSSDIDGTTWSNVELTGVTASGNTITFSGTRTGSFSFYLLGLNNGSQPAGYATYLPSGVTEDNPMTIPKGWELRVTWTITCNLDSSQRGADFVELMRAISTASYTALDCKIGTMRLKYNNGVSSTTSTVSMVKTTHSTITQSIAITGTFSTASALPNINEIDLISNNGAYEYLKYFPDPIFSKAEGDGLEITLTYTLTVKAQT